MSEGLTESDCLTLATQLHNALESGLKKHTDVLDRPAVLARLFQLLKGSSKGLRLKVLDWTFSNYVGLELSRRIPHLLDLHAALSKRGLGMDHAHEFARDAYVYAVRDEIVGMPEDPAIVAALPEPNETGMVLIDVKAFVLQTPEDRYILVFNRRSPRWSLHVRRFWRSLAQELAEGRNLGALDCLKGRTDLTLSDMAKFSTPMTDYADDVEGGQYSRPSLRTFLDGSLIAGDPASGAGLTHRNRRDCGYIVSLEDGGEAEAVGFDAYVRLDSILYSLTSATMSLSLEPLD
jgi:hypothetical protein